MACTAIYYKTDVKSIVWYPVAAFEEPGYAVPTTWDELTALSDQIIADGNGNPWCIWIESQEADGWVATDWMEDIRPQDRRGRVLQRSGQSRDPLQLPRGVGGRGSDVADLVHPGLCVRRQARSSTPPTSVTGQDPMFDPKPDPSAGSRSRRPGSPSSGPGTVTSPDREASGRTRPGRRVRSSTSRRSIPSAASRFWERRTCSSSSQMVIGPRCGHCWSTWPPRKVRQAWIEVGGFISPNTTVPPDWYTTVPEHRVGADPERRRRLRL